MRYTLTHSAHFRGLVQDRLLTVRTPSTYWFCFPGAGEFMKSYIKGRQAIMSVIRKSKYQQILQNVSITLHVTS